jgi:hypothetical protein
LQITNVLWFVRSWRTGLGGSYRYKAGSVPKMKTPDFSGV